MRLLERLFGHVLTVEELDARADVLAADYGAIWAGEAARLPLDCWAIEDYERCINGFRGHVELQSEALMTAISAGHLRDLGIGAPVSGARGCSLHGDACRRYREQIDASVT